jgi:hypothetical protein
MKNKKCALGLLALVAMAAGLSACDQVTSNNNGVIFTYTDSQNNRVSYTAEDLLSDYRGVGTSFSTDFDKVYEVLIRHYYNSDAKKTELEGLKTKATEEVQADKATASKNASANGTTFAAEFQKILTNNNCDNAEELYQYHLYDDEKKKFQESIYQKWATDYDDVNGVEALRDGFYTHSGSETKIMQKTADWGRGSEGWLKEQMPYHTRQILVKLASGKTGAYTQDKIGETSTGGETTKLGTVIMQLAGAQYANTLDADTKKVASSSVTPLTTDKRVSFGQIAKNYSDDTGSASNFGEENSNGAPVIVTKEMSSDWVHEYKLGMYAYESLYNKRESGTTYGKANAYRLAPGLSADASSFADVDASQKLDDSGTSIYKFFSEYQSDYQSAQGIGEIPFGAAVALLDHANDTKDANGATVNEGNEAYYPRNVLFNKYFNHRNVCVITPNAVWSNILSSNSATKTAAGNCADSATGDSITAQNYVGQVSTEYTALPGFKNDTKDILPNFANNVLTDESGNVVLVVRAMSSGYQGIHFIIVQRSALSEYGISQDVSGKYIENTAQQASTPTLSQYYTIYTPDQSGYPVDSSQKALKTFVNFNVQTSSALSTRSSTLSSAIKGYNSNLSSYQFEMLVGDGSISFSDESLKKEMQTYSQVKRQASADSAFTTWKNNWKEYAEAIEAQDQARGIGKADGKGSLLSETVAVYFNDPNRATVLNYGATWAKGGACYYGTK